MRFKEVTEVARHRLEIRSHKNSILLCCKSQHFGIGDSFQVSLIGREEIDCWFTAETSGDDRIVETGIRLEADHPSGQP